MRIPHQYNPKRERLKKKIVFYFCVSIIFAGVSTGLFQWLKPKMMESDFFLFKEVMVVPTEHISVDEIRSYVHVAKGTNIFDIDLDSIKKQVERHPWVLRAYVSRMLPGNIRVQTSEKTPVAILSQGELIYLDAEGQKISSIRSGESTQFPIISGLTDVQIQQKKVIQDAYEVIQQYQSKHFLRDYLLSEVHWNDVQGFVLYTSEPTFEIRLGKEELPMRFERLQKVLNDLAQKTLIPRVIDLNFSKKVVVKVQK